MTKNGVVIRREDSPWNMERREHRIINRTIDKLMEEDHGTSLEEAVSHAINAHNIQINRRGFSPRQIMFGKQRLELKRANEGNTDTQPITTNGSNV